MDQESSTRQLDKYGPTAQRAMQDRAIAEFGMLDSGLAWKVAKSGWSGPDSMSEPPATLTPEFRAMLAAADLGDFDVLVVGYTSRFIRDLALALHYRRGFHRVGVVIYLVDDNLLSSSAGDWDRFVEKAKAAEVSSRDQSKNVRSGYAAKKARDNDPGGHAPFGFRRNVAKLVEPDPDLAAMVVRIVELAAAGLADRDIADEIGLGLYVVRGLLTSPLAVGRLRDGAQANWQPLVEPALWDQAMAVRSRRATNTGRPAAVSRPYALSMLHCASCGIRIGGDTGYYRRPDVCPAYAAATPPWPRDWHGRRDGKGYRRELFENAIGTLLERVSLAADTLSRVVGTVVAPPSGPDQLALRRIEHQRDAAMNRYRGDRDSGLLDRTMARLDREERRRPSRFDPVTECQPMWLFDT